MSGISQERALIFRITHIDNVPWILENGIHCRNSEVRDPNFRNIGDPDLIVRRNERPVLAGPGGTLSDYVPFYFTPFSPMLYKIKTGHGVARVPMAEIVIMASALPKLAEAKMPFVFTDRHAYLEAAEFLTDLQDLDKIDWKLIASRDFKRDSNDLGKVERYQAEALVHRHVPVALLLGMACFNEDAKARVEAMMAAANVRLTVAVQPRWFFS